MTCRNSAGDGRIPDDLYLQLSKPRCVVEVPIAGDASIFVRRHGNPDGPRLVLSHGNGLAADLYYPFWSLLEDRFDLILYDFRNHGWNSLGPSSMHNISVFVQDNDCVVKAIDQHFGYKPKIGVFHSTSALTALIQANRENPFSALVLFDPPLCNSDDSEERLDFESVRLSRSTRRRVNHFRSENQFSEMMGYLPTTRRLDVGVLDLFARTTLRPSAGGSGYELRCPPDYEAQIIKHIIVWAVLAEIEDPPCPTKVIGADPTLPFSFLPTLDLSEMVGVDYDFVPDATHFLQLEQPRRCVEMTIEFLANHGLVQR